MAPRSTKTKSAAEAAPSSDAVSSDASDAKFDRLERIEVRNLGGIGASGVSFTLDRLVALVGENNLGKSTVLRAYELISNEGSGDGELSIEDFPDRVVPKPPEGEPFDQEKLDALFPQVVLDTIVTATKGIVGEPYALALPDGKGFRIRERWLWRAPGQQPVRTGYKWGEVEPVDETGRYEGQPSGFASVAEKRRPKAYRLSAFEQSEKLERQIRDLFMTSVHDALRKAKKNPDAEFADVLALLKEARTKALASEEEEIRKIEVELSEEVGNVFPEYTVSIDRRDETDAFFDPTSLFKNAEPSLRMGRGDVLGPLDRQGSGTQRTLMWSALRVLAKRAKESTRPRLLLIDEPELCLHPSKIRLASKALYELATAPNSGWQVMLTTHSPLFLDLSRDHTTIVRLERSNDETRAVQVFRSDSAAFEGDVSKQLKLLNAYDPNVGEFFFGDQTVVVEGDTEYAAFRRLTAEDPSLHGVHVVRARGKANLRLFATILNQFHASYAVLHDADSRFDKNENANGMWKINLDLKGMTDAAKGSARRVASICNFEQALFGSTGSGKDKPSEALARLDESPERWDVARQLLRCLAGFEGLDKLPPGFVAWKSEEELIAATETPASAQVA